MTGLSGGEEFGRCVWSLKYSIGVSRTDGHFFDYTWRASCGQKNRSL